VGWSEHEKAPPRRKKGRGETSDAAAKRLSYQPECREILPKKMGERGRKKGHAAEFEKIPEKKVCSEPSEDSL